MEMDFFLEFLQSLRDNNPLLSEIRFDNSFIGGDGGISALVESMASNSCVSTLWFDDCAITAEGAAILASLLKRNTIVKSLSLLRNKIGAIGMKHLCQAMKSNSSISHLTVTYAGIGDDGGIALGLTLMEISKTLVCLNISGNKIGESFSIICKGLMNNKTMTHLNLADNKIADNGATTMAEVLKKNKTLISLNLTSNKITSTGAIILGEALACNSALLSLILDNNTIGDYGSSALGEALKVNKALLVVDLTGNRIADAGASILAEALRANKTLISLILEDNDVGVVSAVAISDSLRINKSLMLLDLTGNKVGNAGYSALVDALQYNKTICSLKLSSATPHLKIALEEPGRLARHVLLEQKLDKIEKLSNANFIPQSQSKKTASKQAPATAPVMSSFYGDRSQAVMLNAIPGKSGPSGPRDKISKIIPHLPPAGKKEKGKPSWPRFSVENYGFTGSRKRRAARK